MAGLRRKHRGLRARILLKLFSALIPNDPLYDRRVRIIASLRGLMERERQYAERPDIEFGRVKLCHAGISGVENAAGEVEADLAEGRITKAEYADQLERRLREAFRRYERTWEDEYGFGSSTINSAIDIVVRAKVTNR